MPPALFFTPADPYSKNEITSFYRLADIAEIHIQPTAGRFAVNARMTNGHLRLIDLAVTYDEAYEAAEELMSAIAGTPYYIFARAN